MKHSGMCEGINLKEITSFAQGFLRLHLVRLGLVRLRLVRLRSPQAPQAPQAGLAGEARREFNSH